MHVQNRLVVGQHYITYIAMWQHYVAWTEGASFEDTTPRKVQLVDLATATNPPRTIASAPRGAQVDFVSGDGTTAAFLVSTFVGTNSAKWSVNLVDLQTGRVKDIADSPVPTWPSVVPHPVVHDHWIAWTEVTNVDKGNSRAVVYDTNSGARRTVATDNPAFVYIDGPTLYFDGDTPAGRDLFAEPVDGRGPMVQITRSGDVMYPHAGNGTVVWQAPLTGDPQAVWAADDRTIVTAEHPVQLDSLRNGGDPVPGDGFGAWLDGQTRLVVRFLSGGPAVAVPDQDHLSVAGRWAAAGNLLAWANYEGANQDQTVLYVASVSSSGG